MNLPQNEKELRLHAVKVLKAFKADIAEKLGETPPDDLVVFDFQSVKAAVVWAARTAIRQYCPHIPENAAELDMNGQFDNDLPL